MAKRYVSYEEREEFFELLCSGLSVQGAAAGSGVSVTAGTGWWRTSGLMSPVIQFGKTGGLAGSAPSGVPGMLGPDEPARQRRVLTSEDRSAIAVGLMCGCTYAQIGVMIGRNKSVICREVARNRGRDGSYRGRSHIGPRTSDGVAPRRPNWPGTRGCAAGSRPGWTRDGRRS